MNRAKLVAFKPPMGRSLLYGNWGKTLMFYICLFCVMGLTMILSSSPSPSGHSNNQSNRRDTTPVPLKAPGNGLVE